MSCSRPSYEKDYELFIVRLISLHRPSQSPSHKSLCMLWTDLEQTLSALVRLIRRTLNRS